MGMSTLYGSASKTDAAEQQQQRANRPHLHHEAKTLGDVLERRGDDVGAHEWSEAHHQQPGDYGDVAHRVREKAPALADPGDQHARDSWADHSRAVEHRGIQRDGVHQIAAAHHVA